MSRLCILCCSLIFASFNIAASEIDHTSGKQRVQQKLNEAQLIRNMGFRLMPNNDYHALVEFIQAQSPETLAQALVERLMEEQHKAYSPTTHILLKNCLVALGDQAVAPLVNHYSDFSNKEQLLDILERIGSPKALALVRKALHSPNSALSIRAMRSLFLLAGVNAKTDFQTLLMQPNLNAQVTTSALNYLRCLDEAAWRMSLFN